MDLTCMAVRICTLNRPSGYKRLKRYQSGGTACLTAIYDALALMIEGDVGRWARYAGRFDVPGKRMTACGLATKH
jgi:hypothetical protein